MTTTPPKRCNWCGTDPLYVDYHDQEWGVPVRDDQRLFEFLILEGAQAGLSWLTILRKREGYRRAFRGFDAERIARFDALDIARLRGDAGIVRNRLKIDAAISNARAFLALQQSGRTLSEMLWRHVDGEPRQNRWTHAQQVPAKTPEAEAMSRELKGHGFRFVGPTICYALMQATGMINDHLTDCFRHRDLSANR